MEAYAWAQAVVLPALLVALLLTSGATVRTPRVSVARQRLLVELQRARVDLGIPSAMLDPIAYAVPPAVDGGTDALYRGLYEQVVALERQSGPQLREEARVNLRALGDLLVTLHKQGISAAMPYQARYSDLLDSFAASGVPGDSVRVNQQATAMGDALRGLDATSARLEDLRVLVDALRATGGDTALAQAWYSGDERALLAATSAAEYRVLSQRIESQVQQLIASDTSLLPVTAPVRVRAMRATIAALERSGVNVRRFQGWADQDSQTLASASTPTDYVRLARQLRVHGQALALERLRLEVRSRLAGLATFIAQAQTRTIRNPFTGRLYPAAYEYASDRVGLGPVRREVDQAKTLRELRRAANDITDLRTNLRAMLDNMGDRTKSYAAHRADLTLLRTYGLLSGKAIVVSMREQAVRLYADGRLVFSTYVTTGQPVRPSPPGLHFALEKDSPTIFVSSEPKGSPLYFEPTPIQYAILYAPGGFFLHDAPWRSTLGPGTNLPHYDPAAFNGGSHGCVNFTTSAIAWVYDWTPLGTPILVY